MENNSGQVAEPESVYITELWGKNFMIDEPNQRIQYLDSRFYQAREGVYVPSVTTILEAYPKGAAFAEWLKRNGEDSDSIRDEAGRRGSVVHGMTEVFDLGGEVSLMTEEGAAKYRINEWAMFERYVEFRERHPATVHAVELNMVSESLGYAGTLDRVITIDGTTYIMDIKTSSAVHDPHWMQQAAYDNLLRHTGLIARLFPDEVPEIKLAILWLNSKHKGYGKEGSIHGPGWQFIPQDESTGDLLDMFECVHAVWTKANKGMKPRLTSYSLKHTPKNKRA